MEQVEELADGQVAGDGADLHDRYDRLGSVPIFCPHFVPIFGDSRNPTARARVRSDFGDSVPIFRSPLRCLDRPAHGVLADARLRRDLADAPALAVKLQDGEADGLGDGHIIPP